MSSSPESAPDERALRYGRLMRKTTRMLRESSPGSREQEYLKLMAERLLQAFSAYLAEAKLASGAHATLAALAASMEEEGDAPLYPGR